MPLFDARIVGQACHVTYRTSPYRREVDFGKAVRAADEATAGNRLSASPDDDEREARWQLVARRH